MNTLFSTTVIKQYSLIHENVNDDTLQVIIEKVELYDIENIIGSDMLLDLKTKYIGGTANPTELKLIDEYLLPLYAAICEYRSIYYLLYEIRNLTVGTSIDTQIRGLSRDELLAMREEILSDILLAEQRLKRFICDNISYFPLYKRNDNIGKNTLTVL